jgi:KDO2-lipid IV(A) lauroyltransferase
VTPRNRRIHGLVDRLLAGTLRSAAKIFSALPDRISLRAADGLGYLCHLFSRRARSIGHENLRVVFGESLSRRERTRILRASWRTAARAVWTLLHMRRLTPERYARWVRVAPEDEARLVRAAREIRTGVLVSGHIGNWELLLAARTGLPWSPPVHYFAETTGFPRVDAALDELRDRGSGSGALRKGGAMALRRALDQGKCVGILADRNVREWHGGIFVPFLGLEARTTPLPVVLARRYGVPLSVSLVLPEGRSRWRLWMSPNLMDEATGDDEADTRRVLTRVNDVLGEAIRRQPEAWFWAIKRWKSRPGPERGRYPEYSVFDS